MWINRLVFEYVKLTFSMCLAGYTVAEYVSYDEVSLYRGSFPYILLLLR